MALDSRQKRMSALNLASGWRGPMVDAAVPGFTQGNRQAADFMYSGILAGGGPSPPGTGSATHSPINSVGAMMNHSS